MFNYRKCVHIHADDEVLVHNTNELDLNISEVWTLKKQNYVSPERLPFTPVLSIILDKESLDKYWQNT